MKSINTRFGQVEYDPANTLHFPCGMIGFESLREFIVMPNKKQGPLFWIQSVDDPEIAFVLTDPTNFFLDYRVVPDDNEKQKLAMEEEDDCHALVVVTVNSGNDFTFNLLAPILYSPKANRAIQVVLEHSNYSTKVPLPAV
ncbi:MAG: flagellar assembly protein FliW [Desulfuromonadaceae bacterium GWC2_58_13]|nr:MAG: flagellar assembly protein FliW [Desulfuromonadaceae bacterium GWC2_58_13]